MRYAIPLLLALSLGCGKNKDAAPPGEKPSAPASTPERTGTGADPKPFEHRPTGGSNTVLGKARDRALDAKIMNEMRQVKTGLDADGAGVPGNKAAWVTFLRDYPTLRAMVDKGEVVTYSNVKLGDANTVLMYETRIEAHNDGYVLTADGTPQRVDKAKFATLTKPK